MMIEWKVIAAFPRYEVSNTGQVRNLDTDRIMKVKVNQLGIIAVGLMKDGVQFHRSVSLLVAQAFLPRLNNLNFDTPINLDGDRRNNHVENLLWRPRWFAVAYNRQFKEPYDNPINRPIHDINTHLKYRDSFHVAVTFGLLEKDVVLSIMNMTYVWPTYQQFEVL